MRHHLVSLLSVCAVWVVAAAETTIYVGAAGSTATKTSGAFTWNNIDFSKIARSSPLKDVDGGTTSVRLWVLQPSVTQNNHSKNVYVGDAAEFETIRSENAGYQAVCAAETWNNGTRRVKIQFRLSGLQPSKFHSFTFAASRMGSSSPDLSSTYLVEGATTGTDWLWALNNTDKVARVTGILPRPDGTMDVTVVGRASSDSRFGYLQAFKMEVDSESPTRATQEVFIDVLGTPSADHEKVWNSVPFNALTQKSNLVDRTGAATTIGMKVGVVGGNNPNATSDLTGDAAEFSPAHSGGSQIFGNVGNHSGTYRPNLTATINGLDPSRTYAFTFVASRMNSANNLTTRYTVTGANAGSDELNAANNVDKVAVVPGIHPKADGTVELDITKGDANNHGTGYFYILAMKIATEPDIVPAGGRRVTVQAVAGGTVAATTNGVPSGTTAWLVGNETLVATATAEPGWRFAAWTSNWTNAPVTTATMTIPSTQNVTWTAVFEKDGASTEKSVWIDAHATPGSDTKTWNVLHCLFQHWGTQNGFLAADGSVTPLSITMDQEFGQAKNGTPPVNSMATSTLTGDAAPFNPARQGSGGNQQYFLAQGHGSGDSEVSNVLETTFSVSGLKADRLYTFRFMASRMQGAANYDTRYRAVGQNEVSYGLNPSNNTSEVATLAYVRPATNGTVRIAIAAGPDNTHNNLYYYLMAMSVSGDLEFPVASDARRILWFGNSFSLNGDIPKRTADLAELAGFTRPFIVADLMGGKNLAYHIGEIRNSPANNVESPELFASGTNGWDDVVIQGYSTEATDIYDPLPDSGFIPNATNLFDLVRHSTRGANVRAVLYETWARQPANADFYPGKFEDAYAMQRQITENYLAAKKLIAANWGDDAVVLAPCGRAFSKLGFDAKLYASDLYHQDGIGRQLLAMVLVNRIYGIYVDDLVTYQQAKAVNWTTMTESEWNQLVRAARSVFAPPGTMILVQ